MWFLFDQVAGCLPADYDIATFDEYADAFPDQPVFLVTDEAELPSELPPDRFEHVRTVEGDVTIWEERLDTRPSEEIVDSQEVTVWELVR